MRNPTLAALALVAVPLTGCPAPSEEDPPKSRDLAVSFAARVGDVDVDCNTDYPGVGSTASTLSIADLRFYVSNLSVESGGEKIAVAIADEAPFQGRGVALVDFEDGSGNCVDGNADKHEAVSGSIDGIGADDVLDAIEFDVGVPDELNHLDPSTLEPPLNITSMFWGWTAGYKFFKADLSSTGQPTGFFVHLGSAACTGDGADATCAAKNRAHVRLEGFSDDSTVVFDLGAALADADVDVNAAASAPGCMSDPDDADCAPVFAAFGLPFADAPASATTVFHLE